MFVGRCHLHVAFDPTKAIWAQVLPLMPPRPRFDGAAEKLQATLKQHATKVDWLYCNGKPAGKLVTEQLVAHKS